MKKPLKFYCSLVEKIEEKLVHFLLLCLLTLCNLILFFYTDTKSTRSNDKKKMFLVRVCLGEMYVQQQAHVFKRPPCRHCQEDKCSCESNDFYHAVIGDGSWNFREFIVYDRTQVYPEYVITYERV